jgi:type II secretory pathway component PulF
LAIANSERQAQAEQTTKQLLELLEQNTRLTEITKQLSEHIDSLTCEMHEHFVRKT